jgi:polysaccharide pyruvyl transferase WcaK-like protein
MKKRVYVSGGWGYGNFGDNAILKATVDGLRRRFDCEVYITSSSTEEVARVNGLHAEPSIHRHIEWRRNKRLKTHGILGRIRAIASFGFGAELDRTLRHHLDAMRSCDLVVLSGGGYWNTEWHSMLEAQFITLELAKRAGVPVAIIAQSLGPFTGDAARSRLINALADVQLISVRDKSSLAALPTAGARSRVHITADMANLLRRPRESSKLRTIGGKLTLGLMVQHALPYLGVDGRPRGSKNISRHTCRRRIADAVALASKSMDFNVAIVPSTSWDVSSCQAIVNEFKARGIETDRLVVPQTVDQFAHACQNVDVMLSTNMHPLILACAAGAVPVAISYHFKVDDFMSSVGFSDHTLRIDTFDTASLAELLFRSLDQHEKLSSRVDANSRLLATSAEQNFDLLGSVVA